MVYLKIGEQYSDTCLWHLKKFLQIVDSELDQISNQIKNSADPVSEGLCDYGEYHIGYGFVAIQRYLISTCLPNGKKNGIYKIGHRLQDDLFLIEAVDAGANYWKHEPEWPFIPDIGDEGEDGLSPVSINYTDEHLSEFQKKTYEIITKLVPREDYTLSNFLAEIIKRISPESKLSFSPMIPFIEQWRNEQHGIRIRVER